MRAARVLISKSAARSVFDEVRRWVEAGIAEGGPPLESLLYPLSAMVPHRWRCPLEDIALADIDRVVIDDAAIPPDAVKAFSPHNCHFAGDLTSANEALNHAIDAAIARQPRLAVNSKLHCHPFQGGAFLSQGDLYYGVRAPQAMGWRQRQGLSTALLHVVYPDRAPLPSRRPWRISPDGALSEGPNGEVVHWRIHSWGSDDRMSMIDLGDAQVLPSSHPDIKASRREPYWRTRRGARWCDGQKAALRAAGYEVSRNLLSRGWRRYLIGSADDTLLLALPADFPQAPARLLRIHRAWRNEFEVLELPGWFDLPRRLSRISLVRLARYFLSLPAVARP